MKKETLYILIIFITLMLFPATAGQCKTIIKTHHKIIVIDPGHGGKDRGIITKTGRVEKEITLKLSGYLAERLETHFSVYLTRQDDSFLETVERTAYANIHNADLFISIHAGSTADNIGRFFFFMSGDDDPIPDIPTDDLSWQHQALKHTRQSRQMCDILFTEFARYEKDTTCFITGAPVKLLSGCQMPAIAIEPFSLKALSGTSSQEEFLKGYAQLIAKSIELFFNDSGSNPAGNF